MKKIFILLLLSMYMIGCTNSSYKRDPEGQVMSEVYESPESVIEEYYNALKRGDDEFLNDLFVEKGNLRVEKAIPDIQYTIKGSRIITEREAAERNQTSSNNKLQGDDLEIVVEELLNKNSEEITFILRRINNSWKIYSHSIGYYI